VRAYVVPECHEKWRSAVHAAKLVILRRACRAACV
jgi:hypothetical protein